jgi:hypothetical protein
MSATTPGDLDALLDADLAFDSSTTRGLTNHLPMALIAKAGLGASPEELRRFAKRYQRRLRAIGVADQELSRATWERAIGVTAAYPDLVRFFDEEVAVLGLDGALRTYLPRLVGGLSGAAFHGVIRLSYALDMASPDRVGAALAYFSANALPLGPLESGGDVSDDPGEVLGMLAASWDRANAPEQKLISDEMRWVARQPVFSRPASSLAIRDDTPLRLADVALRLYASTDNFTALHGVTGLEALSRLRPYVADAVAFDRLSFQALAAAYMSIGAPPLWSDDRLDEFASSTIIDHEHVLDRAARSDDEHVAKLVFTSHRLAGSGHRSLYQAVAERAVRNDTSLLADDSGIHAD